MSSTATLDLTPLLAELSAAVREVVAAQARPTWRERLWVCDPSTRLWIDETAEALGKTKASVRRLIERHGLPCRKRHGELVFLVGEVRAWLIAREEIVNPPVLPLRHTR